MGERTCGRPSGAPVFAIALLLLVEAGVGGAQELEPRAYSAAPVGTHFAVAGYSRLKGEVLTDPSLPITDVQADIDVFLAGYVRTFGLAGRTASIGVVVPYARADVSGNVFDAPHAVYRAGLGDVRLRLAVNVAGNPAQTPQEFARRAPAPVFGVSASVVAPTGQYVPARLVNVGSNRWAAKAETGVSWPLGDWFGETSLGAWFFGDNDEFLGSRRRRQDPIYVAQLHVGYNFRPGLWLAFNGAYATGGRTSVDGVENDDLQHNSRYGITLAVPVGGGWSAKAGWSKGLATRAGGDYDVVTVALQYRWFER